MRTTTRCSFFSVLPILVASAIAAADLPTTMPTTGPSSINWDQAKDYIGQNVTVTGPVVGTHDFGDAAVLNVGKDYPSPERFTVYIPADKRAGMPTDLDDGKTISVTGKVKMYRGVPEIEGDAGHIVVIKEGPEGAATQP
jgi:DNA/RNA endonuclease YhcR with UshA esterase domain